MLRRALVLSGALAALAFASPALAQQQMLPMEGTVRADVGVSAFTGGLATHTEVGPAWGITVGTQLAPLYGAELSYNGARYPIDEALAPEGAAMWRNGVSALAKLSPEIVENVRPYVGVGLGLSYLGSNDEADVLYRNDYITELPIAAGVDVSRGNLLAGVRASYRFLGNEEFANGAGIGDTEGGLFSATVDIGGRF